MAVTEAQVVMLYKGDASRQRGCRLTQSEKELTHLRHWLVFFEADEALLFFSHFSLVAFAVFLGAAAV